MAKGDIDGAKLTMSRAILYEKHWDKDNLQKAEEQATITGAE